MEKSIFRTVFFYAAMQLFSLSLFRLIRGLPYESIIIYAAASLILHILIYFFLIHFKVYFFNESTNQPLYKINTANRITLLRISFLPTIAFLLQNREIIEIKNLLLILLILVFLTDSFDGQIARRRKQITKMGQMLDSISDYSLLAVISVVYFLNKIVPLWFFFLIFFRLFLQTLGMVIFIIMKKPIETKSTWGGKITIATTMTLYVIELIKLYLPGQFAVVFKDLEYFCGAVIFILYFEKASIFFKQGKKLKKKENHMQSVSGGKPLTENLTDTTCNPEQY